MIQNGDRHLEDSEPVPVLKQPVKEGEDVLRRSGFSLTFRDSQAEA
jgi:hypothetical protein